MASVKKILKLTLWTGTTCLYIGWADAKSIEQGTLKTPVDGDGYFKYGIYQENSNPKPYLTCVTEGSCPARTSKTRAEAHEPAKTVMPAIESSYRSMGKVHFGFASSKLSSEELGVLSDLAKSLRNRSEVHLRAYTDPVGGVNSKSNNRLARKRANSVKTYLEGQGVKGRFFIEYNPSCCNKQGVTAKSSDVERREMRVVDIS